MCDLVKRHRDRAEQEFPGVKGYASATQMLDKSDVDLVVMATHLPNVADYVWASHGGHLATHSKASVFLVRD